MSDREGHIGRVAILQFFSIHLEPEIKCLRIGDFIAGGNVRSERCESVAALTLDPLTGALQLKGAFAVIIVQ